MPQTIHRGIKAMIDEANAEIETVSAADAIAAYHNGAEYRRHRWTHLTSSRIARSSPTNVSGYIRLLISWRIMRIE